MFFPTFLGVRGSLLWLIKRFLTNLPKMTFCEPSTSPGQTLPRAGLLSQNQPEGAEQHLRHGQVNRKKKKVCKGLMSPWM